MTSIIGESKSNQNGGTDPIRAITLNKGNKKEEGAHPSKYRNRSIPQNPFQPIFLPKEKDKYYPS
jgi:hypothetical protein